MNNFVAADSSERVKYLIKMAGRRREHIGRGLTWKNLGYSENNFVAYENSM